MENMSAKPKQTLGIASVEMQTFREIYEPSEAMKRGTIFKELDLPFYGGGDLLG